MLKVRCDRCRATEPCASPFKADLPHGWLRVVQAGPVRVNDIYGRPSRSLFNYCPICSIEKGLCMPAPENPLLKAAIDAVTALAQSELVPVEGEDRRNLGRFDRAAKVLKQAQALQSLYARGPRRRFDEEDPIDEGEYLDRGLGLGRVGDHVDLQREAMMLVQKQLDQQSKPRPRSAVEQLNDLLATKREYAKAGDACPTWLNDAIVRSESAAAAEVALPAPAEAPAEAAPPAEAPAEAAPPKED